MAGCVWLSDRGALLSKYTALHREDFTLKFLQIRVARWCYCQIVFVVTYSYPNCKVLYEKRLISSHIFIPDHPPPHLTPPLPVVGKTSPGRDVEDSSNYLEDGQKRLFSLNAHSFWKASKVPNIFVLYYWHLLFETCATRKKKNKTIPVQRKHPRRFLNVCLTTKRKCTRVEWIVYIHAMVQLHL